MRPKNAHHSPKGSFCTQLRTRFAETDLQGVVHHRHYLTYCEVARVEYFKALGFDFHQARQSGDFDLVVAEVRCRYLAPARFDELLAIYTWVSQVRHTSFTLDYQIYRDDDKLLLATAQTTLVAINPQTKKARALPEKMRHVLCQASGVLQRLL
ncbi:MAG: acyl-CoA thioesterase [Candidatus Bipolaricaulota bacterium]|nr:acyl-CoA thioesterase [Candidatus Bipolaricaulota bacterium]MCS7275023.1 acyl-CoA thioesterase [Candidatus Bipolaricaulota bacterium]MDW8110333.1 thioesterase family protein [Candidatus Bipolaricaulota bacterium]MDW8328771.1 thioesterase family protein [Candidatus Bipolaricaulota bacterium]